MKTITAQERQNKIYRKMSAMDKLKIVCSFHQFVRKLEQDNDPEVRVIIDNE